MAQVELEYVEYPKDLAGRDAPFRCTIASLDHSSPHWHHEYELLFVLLGTIQVNVGSKTHRLERGDMILFNSREIHSTRRTTGENLHLVLQWSPSLFLETYETLLTFYLNTGAAPLPKNGTLPNLQCMLAEMGLMLYEKNNGYQFAIKGCFYTIISILLSEIRYKLYAPGGGAEELPREFDRIQHYIKDHFKEDLDIDHLCGGVAMSRAKLFRILKTAGSMPVKSLVRYYRVEYAKNLLANSELSIPRIAGESGFDNDSSFYRVFKEITGFSPGHYRSLPEKTDVPPGVQGYVEFPVSRTIKLLKDFQG
jgi:AraC-like DNA-binding protein/mannose-6-phosphate isomerase-like protein (cupin superfamily)